MWEHLVVGIVQNSGPRGGRKGQMVLIEVDRDPAAEAWDDGFAAAAFEELDAQLRYQPAAIIAVVAPEFGANGDEIVARA